MSQYPERKIGIVYLIAVEVEKTVKEITTSIPK
jgi:hypothetical protein